VNVVDAVEGDEGSGDEEMRRLFNAKSRRPHNRRSLWGKLARPGDAGIWIIGNRKAALWRPSVVYFVLSKSPGFSRPNHAVLPLEPASSQSYRAGLADSCKKHFAGDGFLLRDGATHPH